MSRIRRVFRKLMYPIGAELFGGGVSHTKFNQMKWVNSQCRDWEIDQAYADLKDHYAYFEEEHIEYEHRAKTKTLCIDCNYNEGSYCTHDKAQTPKKIAELAALGIS